MKKSTLSLLSVVIAGGAAGHSTLATADSFAEALTGGEAHGDFRLRYESVDQDKTDASALTLRTKLNYKTGDISGFSGFVEFEDSRVVLGEDDYNSTQNSKKEHSVIADPETTELDQAYIQYKGHGVTAKAGRQVLTFDNHRFIGHVGWRQDKQTFDGITVNYKPMKELSLSAAYLNKRNRIFGESDTTSEKTDDKDSKDILLNASYKTSFGTITGYSYMLELDDETDNGLDTLGLRFSGAQKTGSAKLLYTAEFATQENDGNDKEADYILLEGGAVVSGITGKIGYEVLGSDDGMYGFSTPLATLHKFNGWADAFLNTPPQGLTDLYFTLSTKVGPGKLTATYHEYEADEATAAVPPTDDEEGKGAVDDLGSEIDIAYAMKFGKNYYAGVKYAAFSAGDTGQDTDKVWLWGGVKF